MKGQTQIKKEIGMRLKKAREAAGYATAREFCEQTKISEPIYLQHESGERPLKASRAIEYCKYLKVSLSWLMLGKEE